MNDSSLPQSSATAATPAGARILVWDLPVRVFHWLLAASFLARGSPPRANGEAMITGRKQGPPADGIERERRGLGTVPSLCTT